jgi:hypothetical protein
VSARHSSIVGGSTAGPEQWRPVLGFEGYYEVSDQGRVRSLERMCRSRPGRQRPVPERMLKPVSVRSRRDGMSRFVVTLHKDGQFWRRVSHLVLEAFVGGRPTFAHECRHLNCNPSDNRLMNLSWGTQAENHADTLRLGHIARGSLHPAAKLTEKQVVQIRKMLHDGEKPVAVAARFAVSCPTVEGIKYRRTWKHV